jgi:hypothetical protein
MIYGSLWGAVGFLLLIAVPISRICSWPVRSPAAAKYLCAWRSALKDRGENTYPGCSSSRNWRSASFTA